MKVKSFNAIYFFLFRCCRWLALSRFLSQIFFWFMNIFVVFMFRLFSIRHHFLFDLNSIDIDFDLYYFSYLFLFFSSSVFFCRAFIWKAFFSRSRVFDIVWLNAFADFIIIIEKREPVYFSSLDKNMGHFIKLFFSYHCVCWHEWINTFRKNERNRLRISIICLIKKPRFVWLRSTTIGNL